MLFSFFARIRQRLGAALLSLLLISTAHAATDEIVYFHTDANGSPTAAFNEAGEVCWTETYSPYGEKLDNEDSLPPAEGCGLLAPNDVGYTGHVQDNGSDLVYAQQRYYDPQIGRFMSTDPVMPHAGDPRYFGRYHYGANNPYSYTDPTGENFFGGLAQGISETIEGVFGTGDGEFNGDAIGDAFAEGYDGESGVGGFAAAAGEDAFGFFGGWAVSGVARLGIAASRMGKLGKVADKAEDAISGHKSAGAAVSKEPTPKTHREKFRPVRGCNAKCNKKTGEIWDKDKLHKDHYEVYKDKKNFDKGRRNRSVWEDGRPKDFFE